MISLDVNLTTFLVQIAATSVLFLVVKRFFTKPMQTFMAQRKAFVQGTFDEAQATKTQAKTLNDKAAANVQEAKEEAQKIMEAAAQEAQEKQEALLLQGRQTIELEKEQARIDMMRERQLLHDEARQEIGAWVTTATKKMIKKEVDVQTHEALFAEFVGLVGEAHE